ncbi:uncharacterized protein PAC_01580 [Phialocephala subalpina]|uniref:Uncharacterized protein n=1 Tax=Phialocephala subalpina TaxID=576137 RepID=A0A1L7WG11_9HELO|nr:uncharacterized protein PAC_01580 [Phialocephala subalpina]
MADDTQQSLLLHQKQSRIPQNPPTYRIDSKTSTKRDDPPSIQEVYPIERSDPLTNRFREHWVFAGLMITLLISALLLACHISGWVLPAKYQNFVTQNRATTQILVQVLAGILGFLQFAPICAVINRATRLHLSRRNASLDDLRFWSLLCSRGLGWDLPPKKLILLLLFLSIGLNPAAIWAGALTPISVETSQLGFVKVPSYSNISMIKEYPSEFGNAGEKSEVRNTKGVFSYSVGITFEGALLSTAASATTVDGSPRRHNKLDNSGLIYSGRSYGVGSSAGLTDDGITDNAFTTGYSYQEAGYNVDVSCIYNTSSLFVLQPQNNLIVWEAIGPLPNSNGQKEVSTYFGRGDGPAIVAIGVSYIQTNGTQYLGIAAGQDYRSLNQTQCSVNFVPTIFNVTVHTSAGNLTVVPISAAPDIDPTGNIIHTTIRQMELISNDQTNLYQSLLGNSFMASVGDYIVSQDAVSSENATLAGLKNSVAAMLDDILGQYASAQLMVGNQSLVAEATVNVLSMQIGQKVYVYAEIVLNCIVLLIILEEGIRTRGWHGLGAWDYMDIRNLIVSTSKGAQEFTKERRGIESILDTQGKLAGRTKVRFEKENSSLVLGIAPRSTSGNAPRQTPIIELLEGTNKKVRGPDWI